MNITRHISLEDEYVEKLKPYVDKHDGNFGAALRDMISRAGKYDTLNSSAIDNSLLNWILKENDEKLVPSDILNEFIDPVMMNSMDNLEIYLNRRFGELKWGVHITLNYDNDLLPGEVLMEISGDHQKIRFITSLLTQYLVINSLRHIPLEVRSVINTNKGIKVELSGSNNKDALISLETFFGKTDELIRTVKSYPAFWKAIVNRHLLSNYNMVTVHKNYFEDLLDGKIPEWEVTIENHAKKPIREIPLKDMLALMKEVFETSRIVDRVEIDKDTMILFHSYRSKGAIEKLRKSCHALLEANGHMYDARATANIIIMTHRSDVGRKINEVVDALKNSSNRLDQELLVFFGYLKGLKEIPDIPMSLTSLGRRTGKSLMQGYEQETLIKTWTLDNFQQALHSIDTRIHRESEWKLEGKDLLYTVRKCNIAGNGNEFDNYVCHTVRETFKGALSYAFGNKAEMYTKYLLSHGDNFCEVVIRML
ncbi:MAG: hypothetical protein C3F06_08975 [Candidatus Methanoperedenaceae archaeon]|nr:MAG: hypothetical protein C3F06_08975 [Candidatus Methanoperedenaceae archaeon]